MKPALNLIPPRWARVERGESIAFAREGTVSGANGGGGGEDARAEFVTSTPPTVSIGLTPIDPPPPPSGGV